MIYLIYIYGLLDGLNTLILTLAVLGIVASIIISIMIAVVKDEVRKEDINQDLINYLKIIIKKVIFATVACLLLSFFLPSKTTFAAMVILPKVSKYVSHDKDMQELPHNVASALNLAAVNWANNLATNNGDKK